MNDTTIRSASIGHNSGDTALVGDALLQKLGFDNIDLEKRFEELTKAAKRCPEPKDDETAKKVTDFIKIIAAFVKVADGKRETAKAPYLDAGRLVDGYFRGMIDPMEAAKRKANALLTTYLREVEAENRRKAEEAARRQREEEARLRAEAEAQAAKVQTEDQLAAAIETERAADVASADRAQAERLAEAKPAEFSRTRGEYGAVSSLRTQWTFDSLDRGALDLEALRPYLPVDGIEKAVRAFIKAGGRSLKGVRIYEGTAATVR